MPHVRCISCGVEGLAPVSGAGGSCPECGAPWPGSAEEVVRTADPQRRLGALVRLTRDLLGTDVAMLTEIHHGRETARLAAGEWPGIGTLEGGWQPLEETFCRRMLEGRIGNLVTDARADERVADLPMVHRLGVGAWMGVPIRCLDARLYVLCCLAREAQPHFGPRELTMLHGLAASARAELADAALTRPESI